MRRATRSRSVAALFAASLGAPSAAPVSEPATLADLVRVDAAGIAHQLTVTSEEIGPNGSRLSVAYQSAPPLGEVRSAVYTLESDDGSSFVSLDDGERSWSVLFDLTGIRPEPVEAHLWSLRDGRTESAYGRDAVSTLMFRALQTDLGAYWTAMAEFFEPASLDMTSDGRALGEEDPGGIWLLGCGDECWDCAFAVGKYALGVGLTTAACLPANVAGPGGYAFCVLGVGATLIEAGEIVLECSRCADSCKEGAEEPPEDPKEEPEPDVESRSA